MLAFYSCRLSGAQRPCRGTWVKCLNIYYLLRSVPTQNYKSRRAGAKFTLKMCYFRRQIISQANV
jgi:hypothetical protein